MLNFALELHVNSHVDSALPSTREFWRRKLGFPEEVVIDPRRIAEIAALLARESALTTPEQAGKGRIEMSEDVKTPAPEDHSAGGPEGIRDVKI